MLNTALAIGLGERVAVLYVGRMKGCGATDVDGAEVGLLSWQQLEAIERETRDLARLVNDLEEAIAVTARVIERQAPTGRDAGGRQRYCGVP